MKNTKLLFGGSALVLVLIFIVGLNFYKSYEEKRLGFLASENATLFIRDHSPILGNPDAKVYLIEFLDPECESCRAFYPVVKDLLSNYNGKVKFVVRYAPFHPNSKFAIRILEASRKQGKYWEALEILFKYQPIWGSHHAPKPELIFDYLPEAGVDVGKVKVDMEDEEFDELINQDISDGKKLNVRATPTFFVNGKPLTTFGFDHLKSLIESEIANKY